MRWPSGSWSSRAPRSWWPAWPTRSPWAAWAGRSRSARPPSSSRRMTPATSRARPSTSTAGPTRAADSVPTIAIVGAGPGMGMSIATAFGRQGFDVALVSRRQAKVDDLAAQLGGSGIDAAGFAADVMRPETMVDAFTGVRDRFGAVDVLEYSPAPHDPVPGV